MSIIKNNHSLPVLSVKGNFFETCGHDQGKRLDSRSFLSGKMFTGTAVVYDHHSFVQCDYEIELIFQSCSLCHQNVWHKSSSPSLFKRDEAVDKIMVLFGPEINADQTEAALHELINAIKKREHSGATTPQKTR